MISQYMFAIMPPTELAKRINTERQILSERYSCFKALKPPVHITLCNPFWTSDEVESEILRIQNWADYQKSVQIELKNFNFFPKPKNPVVYIDVMENSYLKELHKSFKKELKKYKHIVQDSKGFTPHFTIGYRDVSPEIFPMVVKEYSKRFFSGSFLCDKIYFWKHNGKYWQILNEFVLKGNIKEQTELTLF